MINSRNVPIVMYFILHKSISLKKQPNLTAIALKFHLPCLYVLLRKFAFPFSYIKFDWFFCCYRFLHFFLGLTALKLTNHNRDTFPGIHVLLQAKYHRKQPGYKKSCEMNEFNYFWCQCSFE